MSEAEAEGMKQPDPTEKFRELRDAYLEIWSKNLIETVNSEGYAKASGAALDGFLAVAAPLKEPTEKAMLTMLQQFNMPTSADFMGLSGRFANVELLLDNLDAKLDRIEKLLAGSKPATSVEARVPRAAKKTTQEKQTVLRGGGTSKRTTTAKPVRRNARKVTR
ncbi:MAG: hypothetical protein ABR971_06500 [Acidobacteriaceae bacterium]|jgi:hypothetical protein